MLLLPACALLLQLSPQHSSQGARFVPGGLDPAKPRLLGDAGAVVPARGAIGPFADLDGDGDIDFLHSERGRADVQGNDGFGVFRRAREVSVADERRVGFFDADGDSDLVFLDSQELHPTLGYPMTSSGDRLLDNDGSAVFTATIGVLPSSPSQSLGGFAGDLDGDGDADLLVEDGSDRNRIYWNDGTGSFALLPRPSSSSRTSIGDLNGDGLLDGFSVDGILSTGRRACSHLPGRSVVTVRLQRRARSVRRGARGRGR
jgi:hypothetical protein